MLSILTESAGPRVAYTFALLFERVFPLPYRLTTDQVEWGRHAGPRMYYGRTKPAEECVWLPAGNLLLETGIRPQHIDVGQCEGLPCFFARPLPEADFQFDLPALVFYLASRYEEYLPFTPDAHGRFPAAASLASRSGFLRKPLINLWVDRLIRRLSEKYPALPVERPAFRFLPTFDIDLAWAFLGRPWWLQAGALAKAFLQGRWSELRKRFATWRGRQPDPFFSFPLLREVHPPSAQPAPIFFFLLGDYGPYDRNIPHTNPALRSLVAGLAQYYETGIHLSYRSNRTPDRIPVEMERLVDITGRPVRRNRQHFLKLHLPDTYRHLLSNGIQEDYSMGYADDIGFRASLANPYPWYDLVEEKATGLLVYPFQVMDVTLKNYLRWTPEEARQAIWEMVEDIWQTGGLFCTLWHNSSFGDLEGWAPWAPFYRRLVREIKALN